MGSPNETVTDGWFPALYTTVKTLDQNSWTSGEKLDIRAWSPMKWPDFDFIYNPSLITYILTCTKFVYSMTDQENSLSFL